MEINSFMVELNNALDEKCFTNVKIHRVYIESEDITIIKILCERYNKRFDYAYTVNSATLYITDIESIVSELNSI